MPTLSQSLLQQDLGHLRILAEHWGLELKAPNAKTGLPILTQQILNRDLILEISAALSAEAQMGLAALQNEGGRLAWSQFTRRFGEIREMGPGRRDRERPDRQPISAAESLWYRGLIARAFFETGRGSQEFAYIPTDLFDLLPDLSSAAATTPPQTSGPLGRAATSAERAIPIVATDQILDHTCTLLAALRMGQAAPDFSPYPLNFIQTLIHLSGLLAPGGFPDPHTTRIFLEAPRPAALLELAQTWLTSPDFNDLHHVPTLTPEGHWRNDPLAARQFLLGQICALPKNTWWNLSAFIADIRQRFPDFQRPAGDYDSWFLRDRETGEFLRGFEHWDAVDGATIRFMLTGPMHWLGLMDIAAPAEGSPPQAFRLSRWAAELFQGSPPQGLAAENEKIHIRSDGRAGVPLLAPRAARYQLARFCEWEASNPHEYRYRITPTSLKRAAEQNLRISHLLGLLQKYTDAVPPNIVAALERWDTHGTEVRVQDVTILRLGSPDMLQQLRASRGARFLGEPLGPTTIVVKPGAAEKVLALLAEMGYLGEILESA